jgi:sugar lactone lactonase YvrE
MSLLVCLALICLQHTSSINAVVDGSGLSRISVLSTSRLIATFAGTGKGGFNGDGILANTATIDYPTGVIFDSSGNMHVADRDGNRIRKIDAITGMITTVAGTGTRGKSLDNIAAVTADLSSPSALAFDALGNLFIAEENNHRVRKIDAITGIITTIAGTGNYGYYTKENVPAIGESLYSPQGVATDMFGNVYIADTSNCRIRKVDAKTGLMSTFAGNGDTRFSGEGVDAKEAGLTYPTHITFDASGDAYITDAGNSCIRKVTVSTSIITTVTGICGKSGFLGDGDLATKAMLNSPQSVTFDASGNMVIADRGNSRIRVVDAITKIITTTVGYGNFMYNGVTYLRKLLA